MNLSEVNWDFDAAGSWPLPIKIATIVLVSVLVAGAGIYYITLDQLTTLETYEQEESNLKKTFEGKQRKAVNFLNIV